jgi:membrane protein YqaA with SNARE-associated domain
MRQTPTTTYRAPERPEDRIAREAIEAERKRRAAKRAERIASWAFTILGVLVSGWLFTLVVGIVRAEWLPSCPTIGFGTATLLMALIHSAWGFQSLGRAVAKANRTTNR